MDAVVTALVQAALRRARLEHGEPDPDEMAGLLFHVFVAHVAWLGAMHRVFLRQSGPLGWEGLHQGLEAPAQPFAANLFDRIQMLYESWLHEG